MVVTCRVPSAEFCAEASAELRYELASIVRGDVFRHAVGLYPIGQEGVHAHGGGRVGEVNASGEFGVVVCIDQNPNVACLGSWQRAEQGHVYVLKGLACWKGLHFAGMVGERAAGMCAVPALPHRIVDVVRHEAPVTAAAQIFVHSGASRVPLEPRILP